MYAFVNMHNAWWNIILIKNEEMNDKSIWSKAHIQDSLCVLKMTESHCLNASTSLSLPLTPPFFFLPSCLLKQKAFLIIFQTSQGSREKHWLNTAHSVCTANHAAVEKRTRLGKEEEKEWKWRRQGRLYGNHRSQEWPNIFILEEWESKLRKDQNGKTKMGVLSKLCSFF